MSLGEPRVNGDLPGPHIPPEGTYADRLAQADIHTYPRPGPKLRVVMEPTHTLQARRPTVEQEPLAHERPTVAAQLAQAPVELLSKPLDQRPPRRSCELFTHGTHHFR